MAKCAHCFQKTKQCQNFIVRDENAFFPVYWNCLKKCFACKLNCSKQSLIWCDFHSNRMTTEEFLHPPTAFWKCVFGGTWTWDRVMAELGMEISNNDSWFMDITNRKILAKFYRIKNCWANYTRVLKSWSFNYFEEYIWKRNPIACIILNQFDYFRIKFLMVNVEKGNTNPLHQSTRLMSAYAIHYVRIW